MGDKNSPGKDAEDLSREAAELLREAQEIGRSAEERNRRTAKSNEGSPLRQISAAAETITSAAKTVGHTKEFVLGFHERITGPLWRLIGPPLAFLIRWYSTIWKRVVFVKSNVPGEPKLSRTRATLFALFTFAIFAALTPTRSGNIVRFFTVEPVLDGAMMLFSLRTERFFLNNSEEVVPEENIHAVRGCRVEGRCSETDAVYFRVRPRLSHDAWKLIKYGNPVYVPDHVVAPIAPGVNRCDVTYYGYRMTSSWISRIIRAFQIYPTMLEASCELVSGESKSAQEVSALEKPHSLLKKISFI